MPKNKKLNWDVIGTTIQIIVGVVEIGILVYQCIMLKDDNEEENEDRP